jgi:hypothetical protein
VGEPLSTGVGLINADVVGGAAFVFLGTADGGYTPAPYWTLTTEVSPALGINATSLVGYSVAGARYVKGISASPRILVGSPGRSLDFGTGLLNLGSTFSTIFNFAAGNNGIGKADVFGFNDCGSNIPLPLQLISFKGRNNDNDIQLSWIAENEINFNHYELQRSSDVTSFSTIALVLASGKTGQNLYGYTDKSVNASSIIYYRLKMIDRDGTYKYSPILSFRFDGTSKISVFPNPVRSEFTISMQGVKPGMYRIEMLNSSGQVQSIKQSFIEGSYTEKMYRKSLPSGMYLLRITDIKSNKTENFSLILQ